MITIKDLRELVESTEPAYVVDNMIIYESTIEAFEDLSFLDNEVIDEAASDEKKAILNSEDLKQAKELIKEAKKLKKSDPEASKEKCDQALAKLKKLAKDAEKISDDDAAVEICKTIASFIPAIIYLILQACGILNLPVLAFGALSLIPMAIINDKVSKSRVGHNKIHPTPDTQIIDPLKFNEMSKTEAIGVIEMMIKKAEGIKNNKSLLDRLKGMIGKDKKEEAKA